MEFYATCPKGFEHLLANELQKLGTPHTRPLTGQVAFGGSVADAYRVCLWSRLASRVVLVHARFDARDADKLYEGVLSVDWTDQLCPHATFCVDATGTNAQLRSTQFSALRAKDAIVDQRGDFAAGGVRYDSKNPDVRIALRVSRERASIGIDLAGTPLFARPYARRGKLQGLRADYACALLALGGWHAQSTGDESLVALASFPDSLLVEAALVAANHAPGLNRSAWGFNAWAQHDPQVWEALLQEARDGIVCAPSFQLYGHSFNKRMAHAKALLRSVGVDVAIRMVASKDLDALPQAKTLVADVSDLRAHELAKESSWLNTCAHVARTTRPQKMAVASRDDLASAYLGRSSDETARSMLGREELLLQSFVNPAAGTEPTCVNLTPLSSVNVLVPTSEQFAARLKKMARLRAKWARKEDVSCYRIYDSDLPDYAVTIDLFQGTNPHTGTPDGNRWLQVYEYAAPKDVDATLAKSRLMDVLALAPKILDVPSQNTFLKVRRRDKGGSQYAQEATRTLTHTHDFKGRPRDSRSTHRSPNTALPAGAHLIDEGGLVFEVNFQSRLDCGIFLDHRDTRAMLREMAKQTRGSKRFLNLFAYTGTATCYAADGGMRHTTTVDLSRPSLDWAQRNMARNGFTGPEHEFVQTDVVAWISEQRRTKNRWDLVFCDVPTFSNSKGMGRRSFDVQRDHAELLIGVSRLLIAGGTCVFSCNLRSFRPDEAALAKAGVTIEDITPQTIPADFERNKRIHHAYVVRRVPRA